MKITNLIIIALVGLSIVSCQPKSSKISIETKSDSVSYIIGASDGDRLLSSFKQSNLDSILNMDRFFTAFVAASHNEELEMDVKANEHLIQGFFQDFQQHMMKMQSDTTGTTGDFTADATYIDSISYLLGASNGGDVIKSFENAGMDTIIDMDLYINAVVEAGKGKDLALVPDEHMDMVNAFFQDIQTKKMDKEYGENKKAGEEFLAKNMAVEGVETTESGLQYEVIKEGNGPKPTINDKVKVHYHGTLVDGTVFDSSVDRGEPVVFGVGQVIPGWTEALQLMSVGAKYKLYIPYNLAYGMNPPRGSNIAPYSMLIFEVELVEIVK